MIQAGISARLPQSLSCGGQEFKCAKGFVKQRCDLVPWIIVYARLRENAGSDDYGRYHSRPAHPLDEFYARETRHFDVRY